ncbi:MAG: hypothetical protein NTY15_16070 [Planctomycetota bacterium]|nr:hypothetical protein [Planctomycetota bacterium]
MSTLVLSLLLIPLYVQATAWSAGFGVQGWFRLSQVSAALSPSRAIASVVWIHAMAATPVCFLFCALGLNRAFDSRTRQSLLDFGPWVSMWTVLIPKIWPWIAASVLWSVAMTGNDMVITNLFQVPTITESVYQQVQFNELDQGSIGQAFSFAILVGAMVLLIASVLLRKVGSESSETSGPADFQAFEEEGILRWLGIVLGWGIVSMAVLIPLANLLVKAGWVATMENEQTRRRWSPWVLIDSVLQSRMFSNEILWSVQLGLYSSIIAIVLAILLVRCSTMTWAAWFTIGLSAFLLAIPGPIVNLVVLRLFDRSEPEWIGFLADRTLSGPILAQQTRCLPIVFGVLWLANQGYQRHNESLLRLDQGLPFLIRLWVHAKAMSTPIAMAFAVSFFVSFADLATYLLVQPPQVTTVAMRMFDLLHYGIKNRESGLALTIAFVGAIPTIYLVGRFRRN